MLYNRECLNCGTKYYVCKNCVGINSWKNLCCSRDCFREYMSKNEIGQPKIIENGGIEMAVVLRAGLKNGKTIDINGYDLELGRFDCSDGKTRDFSAFEYFIIPESEFKEISLRLNSVIEKSKKSNESYMNKNKRRNNRYTNNEKTRNNSGLNEVE